MPFRFITSTPQNIVQGTGTFAGISTLAKFLRIRGETVEMVTSSLHFPIYTVERLIFNERLRLDRSRHHGVTVGFDMDGYTLPKGRGLHVASIKGVIADEMRFERGLTNATMRVQAFCEKAHLRKADLILTTSRYSSERIQELYGISRTPHIVPELIDLESWRQHLLLNPARLDENRFVVLSVCRFYPRKRLHVLLGAADRLRHKIPGLEVRIVGAGPEEPRLKRIFQNKKLEGTVTWLGNISQAELAREYNLCQVFCLPSVQEAFGIVFLEAMANAKPVVAARAGAAPEVVQHGILVEPDDEESLAEGIERLYKKPALRTELGAAGSRFVEQFDAPVVTASFLREVGSAS